MRRIIFILLCLSFILCSCNNDDAYKDRRKPTVAEMRSKCVEGRDIHLYYIKNPSACNAQVGSVEHHKEWCWWYDSFINHFDEKK